MSRTYVWTKWATGCRRSNFFVPPGLLPLLPPCFPFSIFFLLPFSLISSSFHFFKCSPVRISCIYYSFSYFLSSFFFFSVVFFNLSFFFLFLLSTFHFLFLFCLSFSGGKKNPRWVDQVVSERPRNLSGQWPNTRNTVDRIIH